MYLNNWGNCCDQKIVVWNGSSVIWEIFGETVLVSQFDCDDWTAEGEVWSKFGSSEKGGVGCKKFSSI